MTKPEHQAAWRDVDETTATRLQQLIDRQVARKRIPHAMLGVARGDGSLRWIGAAGTAYPDGTPMQPDTPYFIASVTKLYIATLILQLYERGDVDLDERAVTYLGRERIDGIHRAKGFDYTPLITVRQLLSHTSGLPDYLEDAPKGQPSMYEDLARGIDQSWDFNDTVRITRELLRPHFPPQSPKAKRQKARYSDTGFQLLIAIIEAVTGQPFHQALEERLFRPLELRHTWLPGHSEPLEPTDAPAMLWADGKPLDIPQAMACFNDLVSTADDTLRFMRALTRAEVFERRETYELMHHRWNRLSLGLEYGNATMRFKIARIFAPGWRPLTLTGHSGSTGSWLFHCPELDLLLTGTFDEINARSMPFRFMLRVIRAIEK